MVHTYSYYNDTAFIKSIGIMCRHKMSFKNNKTMQHFNVYTGMFS